MKMGHPELMSVLEWDALHPASFVVEHPASFLRYISDLTLQSEGEEGTFVFSEKGQVLPMQKSVLLIRDLWSVDLNQKKLLNGVLGQLKRIAQEEYYSDVQELLAGMSSLLGNLAQEAMLPLLWEEQPDVSAIFKAMGVQLEQSKEPFDRLLDYVILSQEYLHTKLVLLVGVRGFLTKDAFESLCRDFVSRELPVLFVDGTAYPMIKGEKRLLIDSDHCELLFG